MRIPSAVLVFTLALAGSPAAQAGDPNCDQLFAAVRDHLKGDARHFYSVYWTTNYLNSTWRFQSVGTIREFRLRVDDLAGHGSRRKSVVHLGRGTGPTEDEKVSLRIRQDGKVVLNDIYGPYEPTCPKQPADWPKHGYAIVTTGDSVEVFNFYREITRGEPH